MKINLPVLYHGTDLRIVLMTEEERKTFKEYCKKVNECPHVTKIAKFKLPNCPPGMFWNTLCRI